jgi:hypothetical protein
LHADDTGKEKKGRLFSLSFKEVRKVKKYKVEYHLGRKVKIALGEGFESRYYFEVQARDI